MHDNSRTQGSSTLVRRAGRAVGLCAVGAVLATGLLAPGTAQAVTSVSAPTLSGDPDTATVGFVYSFFFTTTGNPAPTCAVTAGQLPPGLALGSDDCRLTGTPTDGGDYTFTVTATNGTGPDAVDATALTVQSSPTLTDQTVPHAVAGEAYSFQLPLAGFPTPTVAWHNFDALPDGVTLDPDGLIHGTPTTPTGRLNVGIGLTNSAGTHYYTLWFTVDPLPPVITSADPPDVLAGRPYSFRFTATGDPTPQWFAVLSPLPAGLSLDQQTGLLSGTTYAVGDFPISVIAGNGVDFRQDYTLHVLGTAPQISNAPPAGTVGVGYDFTFDTGGSNPAPTFTVESGTLPTGLTLFSNGRILGVPSQAGPGSSVTVRAANGTTPDALVTFAIPVNGSPLGITGTPSPASQWMSYSFDYAVTGSPRPSASVTDGQLPPGLTLDVYGAITGVPSAAGSYTFTVTVGNGGVSPDASITSTIVVGSPVTIGATPPDARVGQPYSYTVNLTGSPSPTVTVTSGSLPPGLTLQPNGVLSGTPTQAGFFPFGLLASNGVQQVPYTASVLVTTARPAISIADRSQAEGNSGTRAMTFTVSLSGPSTSRVTVHWQTADGTAKAGSDFVAASGTVTFLPGQTVQTVVVGIRGDRVKEPTETLHVRLTNVHGATIADGDALGRILNDD